jgi:hypothetical protein
MEGATAVYCTLLPRPRPIMNIYVLQAAGDATTMARRSVCLQQYWSRQQLLHSKRPDAWYWGRCTDQSVQEAKSKAQPRFKCCEQQPAVLRVEWHAHSCVNADAYGNVVADFVASVLAWLKLAREAPKHRAQVNVHLWHAIGTSCIMMSIASAGWMMPNMHDLCCMLLEAYRWCKP